MILWPPVWRKSMLGNLSLDIMCSSKFTVFFQLDSAENLSFLKTDNIRKKLVCIFLHQMEVIVYISLLLKFKLQEAKLICCQ